jgi:hypothetical protein
MRAVWVQGALSEETDREVQDWFLCSKAIMFTWRYSIIIPDIFRARCLIKHTDNLSFIKGCYYNLFNNDSGLQDVAREEKICRQVLCAS